MKFVMRNVVDLCSVSLFHRHTLPRLRLTTATKKNENKVSAIICIEIKLFYWYLTTFHRDDRKRFFWMLNEGGKFSIIKARNKRRVRYDTFFHVEKLFPYRYDSPQVVAQFLVLLLSYRILSHFIVSHQFPTFRMGEDNSGDFFSVVQLKKCSATLWTSPWSSIQQHNGGGLTQRVFADFPHQFETLLNSMTKWRRCDDTWGVGRWKRKGIFDFSDAEKKIVIFCVCGRCDGNLFDFRVI